MDMAPTLVRELARRGISYDIVPHHHADSSLNVAQAAHVPVSRMVKSVVLEDDSGYLMALLPADQHLKMRKLNKSLDRVLRLADEQELGELFGDCETGAVPPVGQAYGLDMLIDEDLIHRDDLYVEAGNHTELLHLSGKSFRKLFEDYPRASISVH